MQSWRCRLGTWSTPDFLPAMQRRVLTSVSDECSAGSCADCLAIFEREETGEEAIFCVHDCHRGRNQFVCPTCGGVTTDLKAGAFEHLFAAKVTGLHCGAEFVVKESAASS